MSDELTVRDLYALLLREARSHKNAWSRGCYWVMDLNSYKRIRRAARPGTDPEPDEEKWVPDPSDQLFGLPVEVREDGGEPHLEYPQESACLRQS